MKLKLTNLILVLVFMFSVNLVIKAENISTEPAGEFAGGTISGRLLRANGKLRAYTELELVPVGAKKISKDMRLWAISNGGGYFSFKGVPPGKYTLSLNFNAKPIDTSPFSTTFYPKTKIRSEAKVFEVTNGSKFNRLQFRLFPRLIKKKITGKVVWSDGKPVKDVFITLIDVEFDTLLSFRVKTNAQGVFSTAAFVGREYGIVAILMDSPEMDYYSKPVARGLSDKFLLDAKTKPIEIVIKRLNVPEPKKEPIDERIVGK